MKLGQAGGMDDLHESALSFGDTPELLPESPPSKTAGALPLWGKDLAIKFL